LQYIIGTLKILKAMPTDVKTRKTIRPAAKRDANGRFVAAKVKSVAKKKTAGVAGTGDQYMLWEDIKKKYPEHWILLENPVFAKKYAAFPIKGILSCASKNEDDITDVICNKRNKASTKLVYAVRYTGVRNNYLHLL
jgi:hypothetical protein